MNNYLKINAVIILLFSFASCFRPDRTQAGEKIIAVRITEITATQTADIRNYVGTVEESAAVSLSFPVMGTVEKVYVQEGQKVRKGELLAVLNKVTAENTYQGALAKLHQAQDAYDRLTIVHDKGSLSDIRFVEVQTGLQQAKSMAEVAKKNLDDCSLNAPRKGVIAARNIEEGETVSPLTSAFKLVSIDKVLVKIPVPENEIGRISTGMKAEIVVAALDNTRYKGKVEIKGVSANPLTHTYEAKIGIENPRSEIMPGMVCKVTLNDESSLSEIVIPGPSVQISTDGRQYVWLAEENTAKQRFVTTGKLHANGIVISEGLSEGDRLIVEGFQKVSEGMKISTNNAGPGN